MVSANVEGLLHNKHYIEQLIKQCNPDIIAVQEHWLFHFKQCKLEGIHPAYAYQAKSVDNDDLLPPYNIHERSEAWQSCTRSVCQSDCIQTDLHKLLLSSCTITSLSALISPAGANTLMKNIVRRSINLHRSAKSFPQKNYL